MWQRTSIFAGGLSNHDWKKTTEFVASTLARTGMFEIAITTTPEAPEDPNWGSWAPDFSNFRVVILNWNNVRRTGICWPRSVERSLEAYVRVGGGLLAFHSANNAFPHWAEYDRMIGIGWRGRDHGQAVEVGATGDLRIIPPGQGEGISHGPRQDTHVIRLSDHPITRGTPERWLTPDIEVYTFPRGPARELTVLT